jgi:hypothetical protein
MMRHHRAVKLPERNKTHLSGQAELAQLLLHALLRERGAELRQRRLPRRQRQALLRSSLRRGSRRRRRVDECLVLALRAR